MERTTGLFLAACYFNFLFLFDHIHTLAGQLHSRRAKPGPCQQQVIVGPFKQQLGKVIHLRILQEPHGADAGERVLSDYRFDVVVEINNVGFPEA
jgi:hypothetical protein